MKRIMKHESSDELEGFSDLGMQCEALRLARQKLKSLSIRGADFRSALDVLLVQADKLRTWSPLVEAAYARLSKRDQRSTRLSMLAFHYSTRNYERASHFIPPRFGSGCDSIELAFAVDTMLELGNITEANKLAGKLPRAIQNAENPTAQAVLVNCLAEYLARKGQWNEAIQIWEAVQSDAILAENAVTGMAEIHAARALRAIRSGLATIEELKANFDPKLETTLPGNEKTRREQAKKKLSRLEKMLEKIVPKERQRELGIART
jgi:hypothetical protein